MNLFVIRRKSCIFLIYEEFQLLNYNKNVTERNYFFYQSKPFRYLSQAGIDCSHLIHNYYPNVWPEKLVNCFMGFDLIPQNILPNSYVFINLFVLMTCRELLCCTV